MRLALRPSDRPGIVVVGPDVIVDGYGQSADAAERAATDSLACDVGEPALDLIEPRGTGGSEVHVIAWPLRQPFLHLRMLVRPVVIERQMDVETGLN